MKTTQEINDKWSEFLTIEHRRDEVKREIKK